MAERIIIASEDLRPKKGIALKGPQRKELEGRGLFPARVYISERKHGYVESEIDAYIDSRINDRNAGRRPRLVGGAVEVERQRDEVA